MKTGSLLAALAALAGCGTSTTQRLKLPPLETVERVDLPRYMGLWYEIASFPQSFQKGCSATTATYTLRDDGDVDVLNRCLKDGQMETAQGRARVVGPAKLKVSFFRPFWGDYWVVDLADDYSYAVVGHPSRDYLWILSRTPAMDDAIYQRILARLAQSGYEIARLQRTVR